MLSKKLYIIIILLSLVSCNRITDEMTGVFSSQTCRMTFVADLGSYGDEPKTRSTVEVADGAVMFIAFKVGSSSVKGKAEYHRAQNEWSLTYTGNLQTGTSSCVLYYITDYVSSSSSSVKLNSSSVVYSTQNGSYTISDDGSITVNATLAPKLSRVRFKGTKGSTIKVSGVTTATSFSTDDMSFTETSEELSLTVGSDGYTRYVYYTKASSALLTVVDADRNTFTIDNPLKPGGKSGYIDIPTESAHNGWTTSESTDIDASGSDYDEDEDWDQTGGSDHEAVDLGLSVKWATMNVGATEVAGSKTNSHTGQLDCYGEYYAWGETSPKDSYTWSNLQYCSDPNNYKFSKYVVSSSYGTVDNKTTLDLDDDAAHVNWGGSWRMPTYTEQTELLNNCYWEWTDNYNNSGVKGYIVYMVKDASDKGKKKNTSGYSNNPTASYSLSDIHIFLPTSGFRSGSSFCNVRSWGYYWSSSLNTSIFASRVLSFFSSSVGWSDNYRSYGLSVRAVCP